MATVEPGLAVDGPVTPQLAIVACEELLNGITTVEHLHTVFIPDGERTAAVAVQRVVHDAITRIILNPSGGVHHRVARRIGFVAGCPGNIQSAEHIIITAVLRVTRDSTTVTKHRRIQQRTRCQFTQLGRHVITTATIKAISMDKVLYAKLFHKALAGIRLTQHRRIFRIIGLFPPVGIVILTPGTGIPFVGGHQVGAAIGAVSMDRIRLVKPYNTAPGLDINHFIIIAGINTLASLAAVNLAKGENVGDGGRGDVELGQRIVFLQRDPCGCPIGRNRNVLRLQILGSRRTRSINTHPGVTQIGGSEVGKVSVAHRQRARICRVDNADGAFRVHAVIIVGLTFVGG